MGLLDGEKLVDHHDYDKTNRLSDVMKQYYSSYKTIF